MTGGSVVSQEHGMSARFKAILTVIGLLFATTASAAPPPGVTAFVKDHQLARYNIAETDLDGDGHPEALIYAMATTQGANRADLCGSGGCNLYVLALAATRYRLVTAIAITHPPILYFGQLAGAIVKTFVLFRLDKQKWTRQGSGSGTARM